MNVFHLSGNDYRAEITVEQYSGFNGEAKTMHTALTESDIDYAIGKIHEAVAKLRELSPLWDMFKDGVDLNKVKWAAH